MKIILTQGELKGIAPEITEKLELHDKLFQNEIFILRSKDSNFKLHRIKSIYIEDLLAHKFSGLLPSDYLKEQFLIYEKKIQSLLGLNSFNELHFTILSILFSATLTKLGVMDVLVTNPVDKSIIASVYPAFRGHTGLLKSLFDVENVLMVMKGAKLPPIGILTEHIPLKMVSDVLSREKIINAVRLMVAELGVETPVAVAALNPHAGDNGLISGEEKLYIEPAILELKQQGYNVEGPIAGDTLFVHHNLIKFGAILSLYHDQGMLVPKLLAFDTLVNITLGLPIVRTSPGHGVAFDIVGKKTATEKPLLYAVLEGIKLKNMKSRI